MDSADDRELTLFLEERFKIPVHKIPYYISWIHMYKKFSEKNNSDYDKRNPFLAKLHAQFPSWQVNQADKAVISYYSFIHENNKN